MTDDRWDKTTVAVGVWKYDGTATETVRVVGLPYDYHYSLAEADEQLDPGEEPEPLGPDGLLYYAVFAVLGGPGFPTVLQAKGYAQSQVQSEISWLTSTFHPLRTLKGARYASGMSEPWFRRYAKFSYRPATWQGWLVIAAMVVVAVPFGIASVIYSESQPALSLVSGGIALVAALVGHIVVFWKIEHDYRRS